MACPRIAITTGDPAGIGPEIALKAVNALGERVARGDLALTVVGSAVAHRAIVRSLGLPDPFAQTGLQSLEGLPSGLSFVDVGGDRPSMAFGDATAVGGQIAFDAIARAVSLASQGRCDAICTGPISKKALNLAGHRYSGHTELLADLTHARDTVMLLAHGAIRVSHMTTHVALQDVPARITPERLRRVVTLTDAALGSLNVPRRRIAVAALDPHAGEDGLFGRLDIDVVEPTVRTLRREGFDVHGPLPGDTVFVKLRAQQYDAVVAMYHDQGHIPVKLLGFSVDAATGAWTALNGVNVTLGLPIVRTSVDHGTAFDIAGQGIASATSLVEAIEFAVMLAKGRAKASTSDGRAGP